MTSGDSIVNVIDVRRGHGKCRTVMAYGLLCSVEAKCDIPVETMAGRPQTVELLPVHNR